MTFKIVVCIKQVPDTSDIKWTANNTIQREGLDSIINPYDVGAIQFAKNVKALLAKNGTETSIKAVTMGPLQAIDALKTAIAYGCDEGYLLSDKKFSGADTLATAYTLSQFIKCHVSDFSLIICGQQAIDGDTAQTPSSLAEKLNIPQITNVIALKETNEAYSVWTRETSEIRQDIKIGYPHLVTAINNTISIEPKINDYIRAQNTDIKVLDANSICVDIQKVGLVGSPTQVRKAYKPSIQRNTILIDDYSANECADYIINEINQCKEKNV